MFSLTASLRGITLAAISSVLLAAPLQAGWVVNPLGGKVQFTSDEYYVYESDGSITVQVERVDGTDGWAYVDYATANDTAVSGSDYTSQSGTLEWWPASSTTHSVVIPIASDGVPEGDESFTITLSDPTHGVALGDPVTATVYIVSTEGPELPSVVFADQLSSLGLGVKILGPGANAQAGFAMSGIGDYNDDGLEDFAIGAPYSATGAVGGRAYVLYGSTDRFGGAGSVTLGTGLEASGFGFQISGTSTSDKLGFRVEGGGDFDGDGKPDLLIGGEEINVGQHIVYGGSVGANRNLGTTPLSPSEGVHIVPGTTTVSPPPRLGAIVNATDGHSELLVGEYPRDVDDNGNATIETDEQGRGQVHVVSADAVSSGVLDLNALQSHGGFNGAFYGDQRGGQLGEGGVTGVGDVNGDGNADFLMASPFMNIIRPADFYGAGSPAKNVDAGASHLVYGPFTAFGVGPDGLEITASAGQIVEISGYQYPDANPVSEYQRSGWSVTAAGDVNGDGLDDFAIAAPLRDNGAIDRAGEVHLIYGINGGLVDGAPVPAGYFELPPSASEGVVIRGTNTLDRAGLSISSAGDIDRDGYSDLLLSVTGAEPNGVQYAGASYLLYGSWLRTVSTVDLSDLPDPAKGVIIAGTDTTSGSEPVVAGAGDVDGDGYDDFLMSWPWSNDNGSVSGEVYIVYGSGTASGSVARSTMMAAGDSAPKAVGMIPDGSESIPVTRTWVDYSSGGTGVGSTNASLETVTMYDGNPGPLDGTPCFGGITAADVHWRAVTDRDAFSTRTLTFLYKESELNGLLESELALFESSDSTSWQLINTTVDATRNRISGVSTLADGWYAIGQVYDSGNVTFTADTFYVYEGEGEAVLTVRRFGSEDCAAVVTYSTSDGTAQQPDDYTASSGTIVLATDQNCGLLSVEPPWPTTTDPEQGTVYEVTAATHGAMTWGSGTGLNITDRGSFTVTIKSEGINADNSFGVHFLTDLGQRRALNYNAGTTTGNIGIDGQPGDFDEGYWVTLERDLAADVASVWPGEQLAIVTGVRPLSLAGDKIWLKDIRFHSGPCNNGTHEIRIPVADDGLTEDDEVFTVTLGSPSAGSTIEPLAQASVRIVTLDTTVPSAIKLDQLSLLKGAGIDSLVKITGVDQSASGIGDFDGNGTEDLLLGAPWENIPTCAEGAAYLVTDLPEFSGVPGSGLAVTDSLIESVKFEGNGITPPVLTAVGGLVHGIGDVNGDKLPDTAISYRDGVQGPRKAMVLPGVATPISSSLLSDQFLSGTVLDSSDIAFSGFGLIESVGDFNGDGLHDFLVVENLTSGPSHLIPGHSGSWANQSIDLHTNTDVSKAIFFPGMSMRFAGDINGDGFDDLTGGGKVVFGQSGPLPVVAMSQPLALDLTQMQTHNSDVPLRGCGDVDGDGFDDLMGGLGSSSDLTFTDGVAIVFGRSDFDGFNSAQSPDGTVWVRLTSESGSIGPDSGIGDWNGDGFADMTLVTSSTVTAALSGVSILLGSDSWPGSGMFALDGSAFVHAIPRQSGDSPYYRTNHAGDVTGDGISDLLVSTFPEGEDASQPCYDDPDATYVIAGTSQSASFTYKELIPAGNTDSVPIGYLADGTHSTAFSRCWIDYSGGSTQSMEKVVLHRSANGVSGMSERYLDVVWQVAGKSGDFARLGFGTLDVTLKYLDSELENSGVTKHDLAIYASNTLVGPWTMLADSPQGDDPSKNQVGGRILETETAFSPLLDMYLIVSIPPCDPDTDCDCDGTPNTDAITSGVAEDCNNNGMPDNCDTEIAVSLDGTVDYLNLSSLPSISSAETITISYWINVPRDFSTQGYSRLLTVGESTSIPWTIDIIGTYRNYYTLITSLPRTGGASSFVHADNDFFLVASAPLGGPPAAGPYHDPAPRLVYDTWNHIALQVTPDSQQVQLFINGSPSWYTGSLDNFKVPGAEFGNPLATAGTSVYFGGSSTMPSEFSAIGLDNVTLWLGNVDDVDLRDYIMVGLTPPLLEPLVSFGFSSDPFPSLPRNTGTAEIGVELIGSGTRVFRPTFGDDTDRDGDGLIDKCDDCVLQAFTNPVEDGWPEHATVQDPEVFEYEGVYYLYSGVEGGVACYKSKDLIRWSYVGKVVDPVAHSQDWSGHWASNTTVVYNGGVVESNGVIYMMLAMFPNNPRPNLPDTHTVLLSSNSPEGPFVPVKDPVSGDFPSEDHYTVLLQSQPLITYDEAFHKNGNELWVTYTRWVSHYGGDGTVVYAFQVDPVNPLSVLSAYTPILSSNPPRERWEHGTRQSNPPEEITGGHNFYPLNDANAFISSQVFMVSCGSASNPCGVDDRTLVAKFEGTGVVDSIRIDWGWGSDYAKLDVYQNNGGGKTLLASDTVPAGYPPSPGIIDHISLLDFGTSVNIQELELEFTNPQHVNGLAQFLYRAEAYGGQTIYHNLNFVAVDYSSCTTCLPLSESVVAYKDRAWYPREYNDQSGFPFTAADEDPSVIIDLGASQTFNRIVSYWNERASTLYDIAVSLDGETWTPVISGKSGSDFTGDIVDLVSGGAYRFIRFDIERSPASSVGLAEIEVYNVPPGTNPLYHGDAAFTNLALAAPVSVTSRLLDGSIEEGIDIRWIDNQYYMLFTGSFTWLHNYATGYATSSSFIGPYARSSMNPILTQKPNSGIVGTGVASFVDSPDGSELWTVSHSFQVPDDRYDVPWFNTYSFQRVFRLDRTGIGDDETLFIIGPTARPQRSPSSGINLTTRASTVFTVDGIPEPSPAFADGNPLTSSSYPDTGGQTVIAADLGAEYFVSGLAVDWSGSDRSNSYLIEHSLNGSDWRAFSSIQEESGGYDITRERRNGLARYVRLSLQNAANGTFALSELSILGQPCVAVDFAESTTGDLGDGSSQTSESFNYNESLTVDLGDSFLIDTMELSGTIPRNCELRVSRDGVILSEVGLTVTPDLTGGAAVRQFTLEEVVPARFLHLTNVDSSVPSGSVHTLRALGLGLALDAEAISSGELQLTFPKTSRAMEITGLSGGVSTDILSLFASEDGVTYFPVARVARGASTSIVRELPEVTAQYWRVDLPSGVSGSSLIYFEQ